MEFKELEKMQKIDKKYCVAFFCSICFISCVNDTKLACDKCLCDIFHKITQTFAKLRAGQWTLKFCVHKVCVYREKSRKKQKITEQPIIVTFGINNYLQ